MREYSFHLPEMDNDGADLGLMHRQCIRDLCKTYGGATVTQGGGYWVADDGTLYDEPVYRFTVAIPDHRADELMALAMDYGVRCRQLALYWSGPDGVRIIDLPQLPEAAGEVAA